MPFRNKGQGTRCKECAEMDAERINCTTAEEKTELAARKKRHVDEIGADRKVNVRGNLMAEKDALAPSSDGVEQVLKMTMDGMDQAKFRCPRNLASSAGFSNLWRPQIHVAGAIVWGHLECYFLMQPDQPKDANMECSILARCLDLVWAKIQMESPGAKLPRSLIVQIDNTPREGKNQWFCSFLGYLKATEKMDAEDSEFLPSGHSHNEMDQ